MMKKLISIFLAMAMLTCSLAGCGSGSGSDASKGGASSAAGGDKAQSYNWKFSLTTSEDNFQSEGWRLWADAVTEATDGRMQFTFFYDDTLVDSNNAYEQLKAGIADIADAHRYASSGFVISEKWKCMMSGVPTEDVVSMSYQLWDEFEAIRNEYKDVHVLAQSFNGGTQYQLLTVNKKVESVADMKGLTIWCEADWNAFVTACGATPINSPWVEVYSSLQKNMYDGMMITNETLKSMNFAEVCGYATQLKIAYLSGPGHLANLDAWNKLPEDIQKAMTDAAVVVEDYEKNAFLQIEEEAIAWAKENYNTEIVELTDENYNEFMTVLREANLQTAKELDAKGLPGTDIVTKLAEWSAG